MTDIAGKGQLGTAMEIFRTMSDAGFAIGPVILTLLPDSSAGSINFIPFLAAGALTIIPSLLLLRGRDQSREGGHISAEKRETV